MFPQWEYWLIRMGLVIPRTGILANQDGSRIPRMGSPAYRMDHVIPSTEILANQDVSRHSQNGKSS